jgi:hypothetical protein
LIVNAIDDEARLFRTRRGFLPSRDDAFRLIRPMSHIAAALEAARSGG